MSGAQIRKPGSRRSSIAPYVHPGAFLGANDFDMLPREEAQNAIGVKRLAPSQLGPRSNSRWSCTWQGQERFFSSSLLFPSTGLVRYLSTGPDLHFNRVSRVRASLGWLLKRGKGQAARPGDFRSPPDQPSHRRLARCQPAYCPSCKTYPSIQRRESCKAQVGPCG